MPRVDYGDGARHVSMERYEQLEARGEVDASLAADEKAPRRLSGEKTDYAALMERIRATYAKRVEREPDHAAFDGLCRRRDEFDDLDPERWELRIVTDALVELSAKARRIDARYYDGRFARAAARRRNR